MSGRVRNSIRDRVLTCPYHALDNIDYNSLKHFIKANTAKDQAKAIAIPGQPDAHLAKVEGELYRELCNQHARAGLFVTAKADEINRRLGMRDSFPLITALSHRRLL